MSDPPSGAPNRVLLFAILAALTVTGVLVARWLAVRTGRFELVPLLLPLAFATWWFGWKGAVTTAAAAIGGTFAALVLTGGEPPPNWPILLLIDTGLTAVVVAALVHASVSIQRRQSVAALRAREAETFRLLVDASPDAILQVDASGRLLYANEAARRAFGEPLASGMGRRISDVVVGGACLTWSDAVADVIAGTYEPDGEPCEINGRLFEPRFGLQPRTRGDLATVLITARDVTDAHRAMQRADLKRRLLAAVGQAVIATDVEGRITYVNAAATRLYGWSEEEALGRLVLEMTPAPGSGAEAKEIMEALQRGESWTGEMELQRRNGETFIARVTDAPLLDMSGRVVGIAGISEDVTERHRTTDALAESERRFRELADNMSETFFLAEGDLSRVLYVSPAYDALYGFSRDEVYESPFAWLAHVHDDDRDWVASEMARVLRGEPVDGEFRIRRSDGATRWLRTKALAVRGQNGEVARIVGLTEDVTARKDAEEKLEETLVDLGERVKELTAMHNATKLLQTEEHGAAGETHLQALADELPGAMRAPEAAAARVQLGAISAQTHGWAAVTTSIHAERTTRDGDCVRVEVGYFATTSAMVGEAFLPQERDLLESIADMLRIHVERASALRDLEERASWFGALVEHGSDIITILDADGRVEYQSSSGAPLLGWSRDEVEGRDLIDFVHPDDASAYIELVERTRARKPGDVVRIDVRVRHKDGTWRVLENVGNNLLSDRRIHGLVINSRDVTSSRRAEALAREQEQLLRTLADNVPEAFFLMDIDPPRVVLSNRAYEQLFGEGAGPVGAWMARVHPQDRDRVMGTWQRILCGEPAADEFRFAIKPGEPERWYRARGAPVKSDDGRPHRVVAVIEDVTERRAAEKMRLKALESDLRIQQLEEANRFRMHLLNTAAHELATPLTPIILQLQALKAGTLGELSSAQAESVAVLDRNLSRLASLIRDVLDAARLQRGKLVVKRERVELVEIARHALETYDVVASQQGVKLALTSPQETYITGDRERLSQLFHNVLSNAVKFTPEGGNVEIRILTGEPMVRVEVVDTGVGLNPDQLALLFQPFSQAHEESVAKGGTGLGLYISRGIVEQHGGQIGAKSDGPGKGSTFWWTLPVAQRAQPQSPNQVSSRTS